MNNEQKDTQKQHNEGHRRRLVQRKRKQQKKSAAIVMILCLAVVCVGIKLFLELSKNGPVFKYVSQWEKNTMSIVLKDMAISNEYTPVLEGEEVYFPVSFVKDYIDESIFWEPDTKKLTVTTANQVIRMTTDELTYYVNNEPLQLDMPVYEIENTAYIPQATLASLYQTSCQYNIEEQIVIVDFINESATVGVIQDRSVKVYGEADKKSDVLLKIKKEEPVTIYGQEGDFSKIRTLAGVPGYILTKSIADVKTIGPQAQKPEEKTVKGWKPQKGKISMVWDQITIPAANNTAAKRKNIQGLDVVSPTWFALSDSEGNVSNIAGEEYVKWAHENGYQVWALFSNSFDSKITHDVLSDTNKREKVIKQILALAALYDIDGINIDFESIAEADGKYYVQFIRELTPYLKAQGLTVSVDMYVPSAWTTHYDMKGVSDVVDYIALMVYDEHWGTSPKSGSTASMEWSETSIKNALKLVDKNKLIMGVPFFTRLWEEKTDENGQIEVSSSAFGMQGGLNQLIENNTAPVYDEASGQNYGSFEKDGMNYKIWLEDEMSMKKRMEIMQKYDVAGIAGWKRGLEKEGTWDIINQYMGK